MQPTGIDPNWFFSTMAQSTAALVALLVAILLARLTDERKTRELTENKERLDWDLGAWRHNVLATASNALQRSATPETIKDTLRLIKQLAEDDTPFTSHKRYYRLILDLQKLSRPFREDPLEEELKKLQGTGGDITSLNDYLCMKAIILLTN